VLFSRKAPAIRRVRTTRVSVRADT